MAACDKSPYSLPVKQTSEAEMTSFHVTYLGVVFAIDVIEREFLKGSVCFVKKVPGRLVDKNKGLLTIANHVWGTVNGLYFFILFDLACVKYCIFSM
jgi:hypothetical protein